MRTLRRIVQCGIAALVLLLGQLTPSPVENPLFTFGINLKPWTDEVCVGFNVH